MTGLSPLYRWIKIKVIDVSDKGMKSSQSRGKGQVNGVKKVQWLKTQLKLSRQSGLRFEE